MLCKIWKFQTYTMNIEINKNSVNQLFWVNAFNTLKQ